MDQYLLKMKNLIGKLKLARSPIFNSYLIIQTLNRLDVDYNPVVVKLSDQINLSWVDLQAQLLPFENRIEQLNNFNNLSMNTSTNLATKTDCSSNKLGTQGDWKGSNFRGRDRSKPICQVCNKIGHIVVNCFYRYDKSYTCSNHNAENNKRENHNAFIVSPYHNQGYEWYFDSGTSNHATHQDEKLQNLNENNDTSSSLLVGNGERLKILTLGTTKLNNLNLHNVLYVSEITKICLVYLS